MPLQNIGNAELVAIDNREIFDFKQNETLNLSMWSAVWYSKAKRLYFQEVERRNSDLSYRLALVNFLNDIDEVNSGQKTEEKIFSLLKTKIHMFAKMTMSFSKSKT